MARAATTSDAFNAVAEPRRREILNFLAFQECPVGEIAAALGLEQPSVSKHLKVLKNVGLVRARAEAAQQNHPASFLEEARGIARNRKSRRQ